MKEGASLFVFGARRTIYRVINAFEDAGFLLKDVLAWKKPNAHLRAQKDSIIFERRNLPEKAEEWEGWRFENPAPIYEPIACFFKPYKITITDNILKNGVGAINTEDCKIKDSLPTNLLEFGFGKQEDRIYEAQKPIELIEFLIKLMTKKNQIVLDPFMRSGTTAAVSHNLKRRFIGFEVSQNYYKNSLERLEKLLPMSNKRRSSKSMLLFETL